MSLAGLMSSPARSFPPGAGGSNALSQQQQKEEEELLALLSADTFSLESNRDRALLELSSFLKLSLPGAGNSCASSSPAPGWPIPAHAPQTSTSQSTFSSSSSSNSTSSLAYSPPTIHPTPYGTPAQANVGLPAVDHDQLTRPTSRAPSRSVHAQSAIGFAVFPGGTASGSHFDSGFGGLGLGELGGGCRAPAVSRERGFSRPRAGSLARPIQEGTFTGEEIAEDDYAMEDERMEQDEADEWQAAHGADRI